MVKKTLTEQLNGLNIEIAKLNTTINNEIQESEIAEPLMASSINAQISFNIRLKYLNELLLLNNSRDKLIEQIDALK